MRSCNVRSRSILVALTALLAVAVGLAGPFAAPAAAVDEGAEAQFVELINAERRSRGFNELGVRAEVTPIARAWTATMIANGGLSHNPSLGTALPGDWTRF